MDDTSGQPAVENNDQYEVHSEQVSKEPVVEPVAETPAPEGSEDPQKKPGGFKRKITRLESENAQLMAQLQAFQGAKPQEQAPKPTVKTDGGPTPDQYENVLDYLEARQDFVAEQKADAKLKGWTEQQAEQAKKTQADQVFQAKEAAYTERLQPIVDANPGMLEAIEEAQESGLVTQPLIDALYDSHMGEKITEYLYKNPQDLEILSKLDERSTYKAIGMLEIGLSKGQEDTAVRQTRATAPITPVKASTSATNKDPSTMDMDEYNAWRNKTTRKG